MFQLILLAWVIYILYRWLRRGAAPAPKPRTFEQSKDQPVEEMVQDPVCGTWVPLGQAILLDLKREKHYFCSPECRDKYLKDPNK
jgi:YHS domain-containing protein